MFSFAGCILAVVLCATPVETVEDVDHGFVRKVGQLISGLGSERFETREAAMNALAALGDPAVPYLTIALDESDPEVQIRAQTALTMIRWDISPELRRRIGNIMDGFETKDHTERERIIRAMASASGKLAIPTLRIIVKQEKHRLVWLAAVWALFDIGQEGELALAELGVKDNWPERLDAGIRIRFGNALLVDGQYDKAIEQYSFALKKGFENEVVLYNMACAYALKKEVDQALDWLRQAVDAGYDDADWMDNDSDLEILRDQPRYKQILQELRVKERLDPKERSEEM